jgi:hypothetical protein
MAQPYCAKRVWLSSSVSRCGRCGRCGRCDRSAALATVPSRCTRWPTRSAGSSPAPAATFSSGAVAELDDQRPCGHQRPSTLGDELKDRLEIGLPTRRPSDLDRRLERVDRLLQLPAVALSARIAPGVVNRHPGDSASSRTASSSCWLNGSPPRLSVRYKPAAVTSRADSSTRSKTTATSRSANTPRATVRIPCVVSSFIHDVRLSDEGVVTVGGSEPARLDLTPPA